MIPATAAKIKPNTTSVKNLRRKKYPINAPAGSDNPDKNDNLKAFFLLPVAWNTGTETAMPSGILCIAMAKAIAIPRLGSLRAAMKVAIPSGNMLLLPQNVRQ
jgi:hypothetical protein